MITKIRNIGILMILSILFVSNAEAFSSREIIGKNKVEGTNNFFNVSKSILSSGKTQREIIKEEITKPGFFNAAGINTSVKDPAKEAPNVSSGSLDRGTLSDGITVGGSGLSTSEELEIRKFATITINGKSFSIMDNSADDFQNYIYMNTSRSNYEITLTSIETQLSTIYQTTLNTIMSLEGVEGQDNVRLIHLTIVNKYKEYTNAIDNIRRIGLSIKSKVSNISLGVNYSTYAFAFSNRNNIFSFTPGSVPTSVYRSSIAPSSYAPQSSAPGLKPTNQGVQTYMKTTQGAYRSPNIKRESIAEAYTPIEIPADYNTPTPEVPVYVEKELSNDQIYEQMTKICQSMTRQYGKLDSSGKPLFLNGIGYVYGLETFIYHNHLPEWGKPATLEYYKKNKTLSGMSNSLKMGICGSKNPCNNVQWFNGAYDSRDGWARSTDGYCKKTFDGVDYEWKNGKLQDYENKERAYDKIRKLFNFS